MKYIVSTWAERDRAYILVTNPETGKEIFELWDEAVSEFIEDGFIKHLNDVSGLKEYLKSHNIIEENDHLVKT